MKNNKISTSTKPMPIYDESHKLIGYVSNYYISLEEKLFAFSGLRLYISLQAEDRNGKIHIRIISN
ncbi:MAG: tubby C-terminal domain-like protein [Syntrophomonadaceae bacterium]